MVVHATLDREEVGLAGPRITVRDHGVDAAGPIRDALELERRRTGEFLEAGVFDGTAEKDRRDVVLESLPVDEKTAFDVKSPVNFCSWLD